MLPLNYTAERKPIAIPVDLKPRHRGSDMAHKWRTAPGFLVGGEPEASAEPSVHRDTEAAFRENCGEWLEMGGYQSSACTRSNDKEARILLKNSRFAPLCSLRADGPDQ